MDNPKNNVIPIKFREVQVTDQELLIESIREMEFDDVMVVGIKDGEIYMAHTDFESRLQMMGAVSGLEHWLWNKGEP